MRRWGKIRWIPTIDLEPADPHSSTASHHAILYPLTQQSNPSDSSLRSSVSCDTVRQESDNSCYSILDIINEFTPFYTVDSYQYDVFPSNTVPPHGVLDFEQNTKSVRDDPPNNDRGHNRYNRRPLMIQLTNDDDNNKSKGNDAVAVVSDINIPFADKRILCTDGKTGSCSSLYSETDAEYFENDEHKLKEPSISYTIDDMNCITPIPPISLHQNNANTSKLYAFLFDSVDTDSDDDIFPMTSIQLEDFKVTHNKTVTDQNKRINTIVPCKPLAELF